MRFAEIGRILGASPNTVASRYQYAMAKLARGLLREQPEALG
jgi:DNA-directed RNA polymerase specialized sigma24 family protein